MALSRKNMPIRKDENFLSMPDSASEQKLGEMSDNELVMLVKKNPESYKEISARYQGKLFAYLYRLIGDKDEAEDLLQNVFIKAYRNLDSYDTNRKFSSWIYRIAHNEAVNHIKRKSLKRFVSLDNVTNTKDKLDSASAEDNAHESWIRKETGEEVDEAIKKLPLKYRQVLILRYYSDKSYEEISEILGRPVNTVGTLIKRAKSKLSVELDDLKWNG
jgi:RNA polymerase sigma-70 factor (ECF subfamily)